MRFRGFTMIELIFVIVILGILAAFAIPRLSATRDDAVVSKKLMNLGIFISDVTSFYTANNKFNKISNMTRVRDFSKNDLEKIPSANNEITIAFLVKNENCANITFKDNNITVIGASSPRNNACKMFLDADVFKQSLSGTKQILGVKIKYD